MVRAVPKKRPLEQYRGQLSPQEIAAGMNAAARNAKRLLDDAQALAKERRYPSACSVAILSIEEASKASLLRLVATAENERELNNAWKLYRNHQAKNATWIFPNLVNSGARALSDFGEITDPNSDHPAVLDSIKQLGFYTDCYAKGHWSEPNEVINEKLTDSIITVAEILCPKRETPVREVELWIRHVGHSQTKDGLMAWRVAMKAEGLVEDSSDDFERFVLDGP
jgi:AbiV family abortive infection protein